MRRVVTPHETRRIDLGDGDWVDVKRRLTAGDREVINTAIAEASDLQRITERDGQGREVEHVTGVNWAASLTATLLVAVRGWGGPGFCEHDHEADGSQHDEAGATNGCRPLPISRDTLTSLDDQTANRIVAEVNSSNPVPRKEDTAHP